MVDICEMEAVLSCAESKLNREAYETLRAVVDSYKYIAELTLEPGMTIDRLRELYLGPNVEQPET